MSSSRIPLQFMGIRYVWGVSCFCCSTIVLYKRMKPNDERDVCKTDIRSTKQNQLEQGNRNCFTPEHALFCGQDTVLLLGDDDWSRVIRLGSRGLCNIIFRAKLKNRITWAYLEKGAPAARLSLLVATHHWTILCLLSEIFPHTCLTRPW